MKNEQRNWKRFAEERLRLQKRRRRLYALAAALSLTVAAGVTAELVRPAITATAQPQCGMEDHVHSGACYEQVLTCGQETGEEHTHGEECYATVLTCTTPEHTHTEGCYPATLAEPTLVPEESKPDESKSTPEEPQEPAKVEETPQPTEVTTPAPMEEPASGPSEKPAETPEEAPTAEPTESPEETPEATAAPETPEPSEEPEETEEPAKEKTLKLENLTGPERLLAGQEGEWSFAAENAERLFFTLLKANGSQAARQELSPESRSFRYAVPESGLYTVRVTAERGEGENLSVEQKLAVSAGELQAAVSTASRSCFGGDTVAFALSAQGGVAPLKRSVTIWQGGENLLEEDNWTENELRVTARPVASNLYLRLTVTDACGDRVEADQAVPCAVHTTETSRDWEATFASVHLSGRWPDDLLAIARTQLGYGESPTDFIVDENGQQKGYTRYGRWYGSEYADWCAMYVSFCLHYAGVPQSAFPQEAGCGSWVNALRSRGLYHAPGEYTPKSGDLIFFDWQQNGQPDHVGIVEKADGSSLTVIEGNSDNSVQRNLYRLMDGTICGFGSLNDAFERFQSAEATETPEPAAEPSAEPTLMPDENPAESPSPEPSLEPENTPEVSPEPVLTELEKLTALVDSLTDAEEGPGGTESAGAAEASFEERYAAALEAVLTAWNVGNITPEEAIGLVERLIALQPGGTSPAYETLREDFANLQSPAEDAAVNEKMEYIHQISALREQLAAADGSGELTRPEKLTLQYWLDHAPACTVDCVYTALDGAVRVLHTESGEWQQRKWSARVYSPEEAEATALREELALRLALEERGAIAELMLVDVDFDADENGAEVTLRLDEAVAAGEELLAAHRGPDGWEWLDFERLTGEDGRQYVRFHTDSFSPFAVLSLTEAEGTGADLETYVTRRGGRMTFRLTCEDGTEPEADEEGVYTVEQGVEFLLHMDVSCPEGFAGGLYALAFPDGVVPSLGEDTLTADETEIGQWSADGESSRVLLRLEGAEAVTAFPVEIRVSFVGNGGEMIHLGDTITLRCYAVPDGPVSELCVGDAWMALRDSGYFTYWSDKIKETETYELIAARAPAAVAPQTTEMPSDQQVIDRGGAEESPDGVKISKTIQGTELENVFDITLTVQTPTKVSEFYEEPDMAVVIVMDISNTMNSNFGGKTRYAAAMEAANQFLDKFAAASKGVSKVGYVAFNTNAHKIFDLQECSSTTQANRLKDQMLQKTGRIINADGYAKSHDRFTNIEAGLKLGRDMLASATNQNKYIIFLSDGFPTTYVSSGYRGYDPYCTAGTPGRDGVFYDSVTKKYCQYGTSYSDKAAIRAREVAGQIKTGGITIFSIGVDVDGQTVQKYVDQTANSNFSVVDRTSESYEIGSASSADAYKGWLKNSIGSGYYYDSTNSAGLNEAYNKIFEAIKKIHEESATAIWVTNDHVPTAGSATEGIEFIGFYTKNGQLVGDTLAGNGSDGENTASFNETSSDIRWDLKNSGYKETQSGDQTLYDYSITYRVRLKNESDAFVEHQKYVTNGETRLDYQTVESINGEKTISEIKKLWYPVPSVKGYLAELRFQKNDQSGEPLSGAEFTLAHDTERCNICRGDHHHSVTIAPLVAVSDADGKVSFTRIPSGHQYILTETGVPAGYLKRDDTYAVKVAYDKLTVTVTHQDQTTEKWNGTNQTIVNDSRPRLPDTGGSGIQTYTIGGIALMAISLLYGYATNRRRRRGSVR